MSTVSTTPLTIAYRIRECKDASDADHLHAFVGELADCAGKLDAVSQTPQHFVRDAFERSPPLFYFAFAEKKSDGSQWEPVGFVVWYFTYSTWRGRTLFIEDLYVREHYRRNGLGKKLFAHCVKQAHGAKCPYVEWVVLKWNDKAKNMYESLGAEYPEGGVWDLMRLEEEAIAKFMEQHVDP